MWETAERASKSFNRPSVSNRSSLLHHLKHTGKAFSTVIAITYQGLFKHFALHKDANITGFFYIVQEKIIEGDTKMV